MTPQWTVGGVRVRFSLLFPAMLCFLCLQQADLTVACLLAALMHEGGHLLMLLLLKDPPKEIRFSAFGMCIVLSSRPLRSYERIMVALGGPAVNFLTAGLLLAWGVVGDPIGIHLTLGGMNLLPVWPLDGGQCLPEGKVRRVVSLCFLILLSALAVGVLFFGNVSLAVVTVYLWFCRYSKTKD